MLLKTIQITPRPRLCFMYIIFTAKSVFQISSYFGLSLIFLLLEIDVCTQATVTLSLFSPKCRKRISSQVALCCEQNKKAFLISMNSNIVSILLQRLGGSCRTWRRGPDPILWSVRRRSRWWTIFRARGLFLLRTDQKVSSNLFIHFSSPTEPLFASSRHAPLH